MSNSGGYNKKRNAVEEEQQNAETTSLKKMKKQNDYDDGNNNNIESSIGMHSNNNDDEDEDTRISSSDAFSVLPGEMLPILYSYLVGKDGQWTRDLSNCSLVSKECNKAVKAALAPQALQSMGIGRRHFLNLSKRLLKSALTGLQLPNLNDLYGKQGKCNQQEQQRLRLLSFVYFIDDKFAENFDGTWPQMNVDYYQGIFFVCRSTVNDFHQIITEFLHSITMKIAYQMSPVVLPLLQNELDQLRNNNYNGEEYPPLQLDSNIVNKLLKLFLVFQGIAREVSRFDNFLERTVNYTRRRKTYNGTCTRRANTLLYYTTQRV